MVAVTFPTYTKTWHQKPYPSISVTRPELSQAGQVTFITGGGTGIGKAIAESFIKAGAEGLIIVGRREELLQTAVEELSKFGKTKIIYAVADVTDPVTTGKAFALAIETFGKIDNLILNAGYFDTLTTIKETDFEPFWLNWEINVKGLLVVTQAFLKVSKPGATVISVSSAAAFFKLAGNSAYSASKASGIVLMEYLHDENPDLRVFSIQPGQVPTEMFLKSGHSAEGMDSAELPGSYCVWLSSQESEFLRGKFSFANFDVDELKEKAEEIKEKGLLVAALKGWNTAS